MNKLEQENDALREELRLVKLGKRKSANGFTLVRPTKDGAVLASRTITIEELAEGMASGSYAKAKKGGKTVTIPGIVLNRFNKRRRYIDLVALTGWIAFDIDKLNEKYPHIPTPAVTKYIRERLARHPKIRLAFVSQSGNGVKALGYFRKPSVSVSDLRSTDATVSNEARAAVRRYYLKKIKDLRPLLGLYSEVEFDLAQGVTTQVLYVSHDPDLIFKP